MFLFVRNTFNPILSGNPYETAPDRLAGLSVEKTILSGKEYRPQSRSWLNAVISGMFSGEKA